MRAFEACVSACRDSNPELCGVAMAALAVSVARIGDHERAQTLLDESGTRLQGWALERIRWRIRVGIVAVWRGDLAHAMSCLEEVRQSIDDIGIGSESPIRGIFKELSKDLQEHRSAPPVSTTSRPSASPGSIHTC